MPLPLNPRLLPLPPLPLPLNPRLLPLPRLPLPLNPRLLPLPRLPLPLNPRLLPLPRLPLPLQGPYFLGSELSLVDITFTPMLERMAASLAYYKGMYMRGRG